MQQRPTGLFSRLRSLRLITWLRTAIIIAILTIGAVIAYWLNASTQNNARRSQQVLLQAESDLYSEWLQTRLDADIARYGLLGQQIDLADRNAAEATLLDMAERGEMLLLLDAEFDVVATTAPDVDDVLEAVGEIEAVVPEAQELGVVRPLTQAFGSADLAGFSIRVPLFDASGNAAGLLIIIPPQEAYILPGYQDGTSVVVYDADNLALIDLDGLPNLSSLDRSLQRQIEGQEVGVAGFTRMPETGWVVVITENAPSATAIPSPIVPLLIGGVLILGFVIGMSAWAERNLQRFAEVSQTIVNKNDLTVPIPSAPEPDLSAIGTALKSLTAQLSYRGAQLDTVTLLSQASTVEQSENAYLDNSARTIYEQLKYRAVRVFTVDEKGGRAIIRSAYGDGSEQRREPGFAVLLDENSIVGRAILSAETIKDDGLAPTFAGMPERYAEIVVPFAGDVQGALHIIGQTPNAFDNQDFDIVRVIANQIGTTLTNRNLYDEAQVAKAQAEEANKVKSHFLANMSHELRTPLNAILNFTGFVADGDEGPVNEDQADLLNKVIYSAEHLLNLINDILDLSKIESGAMQMMIREVNMNQLVDSISSTARGLVKDKPIDVQVDIANDLPLISGDQRRLRQVLLNLISNAVKFTPEGFIRVEAKATDDEILITVKDTGIGMAEEDHAKVFQTFEQAKHNLDVIGTGLGMPISKHFVEAHGGKLWFASALGEGTTFYMSLPLQSELTSTIESIAS